MKVSLRLSQESCSCSGFLSGFDKGTIRRVIIRVSGLKVHESMSILCSLYCFEFKLGFRGAG